MLCFAPARQDLPLLPRVAPIGKKAQLGRNGFPIFSSGDGPGCVRAKQPRRLHSPSLASSGPHEQMCGGDAKQAGGEAEGEGKGNIERGGAVSAPLQ